MVSIASVAVGEEARGRGVVVKSLCLCEAMLVVLDRGVFVFVGIDAVMRMRCEYARFEEAAARQRVQICGAARCTSTLRAGTSIVNAQLIGTTYVLKPVCQWCIV
jgi:hypothetical protein